MVPLPKSFSIRDKVLEKFFVSSDVRCLIFGISSIIDSCFASDTTGCSLLVSFFFRGISLSPKNFYYKSMSKPEKSSSTGVSVSVSSVASKSPIESSDISSGEPVIDSPISSALSRSFTC